MRDIRYQFKILTTALFTCSLLGRRFTRQQILALCVLTLGVGLVQVDTANGGSGEIVGAHHQQTHLLGVGAVLLACCTSGFAGVYFERVLKNGKQVCSSAYCLLLTPSCAPHAAQQLLWIKPHSQLALWLG